MIYIYFFKFFPRKHDLTMSNPVFCEQIRKNTSILLLKILPRVLSVYNWMMWSAILKFLALLYVQDFFSLDSISFDM